MPERFDDLAGLLPRLAGLPTPALVLDEAAVEANIAHTLALVGTPRRWRAHVKTARIGWTVDRLLAAGVTRFKAATVGELAMLLDRGALDVLLAYPAVGPARAAASALADRHPRARVSILVDTPETAGRPGRLAAFLDVDTGLHRTGVDAGDAAAALAVLSAYREAGWAFAGVHAYGGHLADLPGPDRAAAVRDEVRRLTALVRAVEAGGHAVPELCTGTSHTFHESVQAAPGGTVGGGAAVTVGAGTVVYNDARSLARFAGQPAFAGFRAAAGVLTRVVSRRAGQVTVDAGLTAIQVDAGRPHAVVAGHPGVVVGAPSQEHLVLTGAVEGFGVGESLMLLPRHVDTALAQFGVVHRVGGEGTVRPEEVSGRHQPSSPA
ncbi:alanine racemase [Nonomuraea pusilla]|uniref:D-serine deaminase, pyridoxal phosphate-dependent n=1 Tax=Nonomuraea pusilla TaxID=46177 RepID=A0A1H7YCK9_9ACTN|nr:alanine racemase [Nonomuraea pusilla]SEM42909.1 D-serine deaminase, pyridoxal phosphate-dependent [Nonomuraea pusilla]